MQQLNGERGPGRRAADVSGVYDIDVDLGVEEEAEVERFLGQVRLPGSGLVASAYSAIDRLKARLVDEEAERRFNAARRAA